MDALTITIHRTVEDEYYFRVRDDHQHVLLTSINYQHMSDCMHEIYMAQCSPGTAFVPHHCTNANRWNFSLQLTDMFVIAVSPDYLFERTMREDIARLLLHIKHARIVDLSSFVRFCKRVKMDK